MRKYVGYDMSIVKSLSTNMFTQNGLEIVKRAGPKIDAKLAILAGDYWGATHTNMSVARRNDTSVCSPFSLGLIPKPNDSGHRVKPTKFCR